MTKEIIPTTLLESKIFLYTSTSKTSPLVNDILNYNNTDRVSMAEWPKFN
jgi:hypothetical protein